MSQIKFFLIHTFILFCFVVLMACGSSGTSSSSHHNTGDPDPVSLDTTAGSIFPTNLVVSSPYATSSSSASINAGVLMSVEGYEEGEAELIDMLSGTEEADCAFSMNFQSQLASPECYGPQVNYNNHPGGGSAQLPGGDLGLWDSTTDTGDVCAVAKINQMVDTVGSMVDAAVNIFAGMACSLNVNETELPIAGESLDMKTDFAAIITANHIEGVTVDSATLERASEDDESGFAIYNFTFSGTLTAGDEARDVQFYLRHIPLDDDNVTYKGKLSYQFSYEDESGGNSADAGSVLYHKTSTTELTYRLQSANYVGNPGVTPDPLDGNFEIDPATTSDEDSETGWHSNFNYALFEVNPENGTGSYAFAWSAGNGNEDTRVFNATVSEDDDGLKSGCAYYGYGPTVQSETDLGSISGMICNWAGPGNNHTISELVQRQCVTQDEDGAFVLDTATGYEEKIQYAPTNDCDYAGGTFYYASADEDMSNDVPEATDSFSNELLDVDEMDFVLPDVPDDVY